MLEQSGCRGFRDVTVQDAIDACGTNRVQFYRHFSSKAECYATAHEEGIEALCEELLAAGAAEEDWAAGLCAALRTLGSRLVAAPVRMRGLLVEVHVAGAEALVKRGEILERLSRAVDRARKDLELGHASPPPLTAPFMVGAIEATVTRSLLSGRPEDFVAALPELAQMIAIPYLKVRGTENANGPKELGNLLRAEMSA